MSITERKGTRVLGTEGGGAFDGVSWGPRVVYDFWMG